MKNRDELLASLVTVVAVFIFIFALGALAIASIANNGIAGRLP